MFLVAGIALSGCIPFPHREAIAPRIEGRLRSGSSALPGITVTYGYKNLHLNEPDCLDPDTVGVTAADGSFSFERDTKFRVFLVIGDRFFRYDVCAALNGVPVLLWSGSDLGAVGETVKIACDIDRPIQERGLDRGRCDVTSPVPIG